MLQHLFDQLPKEIHLKAAEYAERGLDILPNFLANSRQKVREGFAMKGAFEGVPAIICGAGKSLEESAPLIKEGALIFAGGSALSVLSDMGITPHFAGYIDQDPDRSRFAKIQDKSMPLFFQSRVASDVLEGWKGEKVLFPGNGNFPIENWLWKKEYPPFDAGWNVASFLTAVAHFLGCYPLYHAGVDFGGEYALGMEGKGADWQAAKAWLKDWDIHYDLKQIKGEIKPPQIEAPFLESDRAEKALESFSRMHTFCRSWLEKPSKEMPKDEVAYDLFLLPIWEMWEGVFAREVPDAFGLEINKWLFMLRICDEALS